MAEYLVQYGRSAFVGRFASEVALARGDRAVIDSPRGRELGTVLCEPEQPSAQLDGNVVRRSYAHEESATDIANRILEAATAAILRDGHSALVLDCEVLLDGGAILHVVAWEPVDLTPILEELSVSFARSVRLFDLSTVTVPADPTKCGKPDCGSGGCSSCGTGGGCGTSSCSRGVAKSSDDLTAQFRELREAMERDVLAGRRELL